LQKDVIIGDGNRSEPQTNTTTLDSYKCMTQQMLLSYPSGIWSGPIKDIVVVIKVAIIGIAPIAPLNFCL
jgi:hypothetical protein